METTHHQLPIALAIHFSAGPSRVRADRLSKRVIRSDPQFTEILGFKSGSGCQSLELEPGPPRQFLFLFYFFPTGNPTQPVKCQSEASASVIFLNGCNGLAKRSKRDLESRPLIRPSFKKHWIVRLSPSIAALSLVSEGHSMIRTARQWQKLTGS